VDHALGCPQGCHDIVEEATVNGVIGLRDVNKHNGSRYTEDGQKRGEEGCEIDVVGDEAPGQKSSLFTTDGRGEGSAEPGGEDSRKEAVKGREESDWAVGYWVSDIHGACF